MKNVTVLVKPVSGLCNMRCKYCFYNDVTDNREIKSYGIMSEETLELMVKRVFECAEISCSFCFQGGEPTLAKLSFFKKFINYVHEYNLRNIHVHKMIQTNGYLIDEEWAKFLHDNNFLVGLSLDGTKDIHDFYRIDERSSGTFNKVIRCSKIFNKYNVQYNVLCVVTDNTARHGKKIYSFFKKCGFKYLQFIKLIDPFDDKTKVNGKLTPKKYGKFMIDIFDEYYNDYLNGIYVSVREFDNFIRLILNKPAELCGMNGVCTGYFVIESDGSIYPCDFYVTDTWRLGSLRKNSFEELLNSEVMKKFIISSAYISDGCKECKWFGICRGGCRRYREPFIQGKPTMNKFCESYKIFFEHSYYKMQCMADLIKNNYKNCI